jgi:hypothetical protein
LIVTGTIVVALLLALLRRNDVQRLASVRFRFWQLILLAAALRAALALAALPSAWSGVSYAASLWILVLVALRNIALPGAGLVTLALLANALVISANGGAMPVSPEALALADERPAHFDRTHVPLGADTVLPTLADVVPVPLFRGFDLPFGRVYSLGDFALAAGLFAFITRTASKREATSET